MNRHRSEIFRRDGDLLRTLTRALLLTAGLVVLLWFLYQTLRVLKMYFDEFYLARQPEDSRIEERVEAMMDRDAERAAGEEEPPPRERARRESS